MKWNSQIEFGQREKVIVWGAGRKTEEFLSYREYYCDIIEIAAIVDADRAKWGKSLEGYKVISPEEAYEIGCGRFIVPSEQYFDEIADRIIVDTGIKRTQVEQVTYITKCKLAARYGHHSDKLDILAYLSGHPLSIFNYPFVEKYEDMNPEIGYDEDAELFYVIHNGFKMYMSRKLSTKEKVSVYYKSLCMEQDEHSPHRYLQKGFDVERGDVVLDVGAAEGIFTLGIIDRAKKIYLIETDTGWIEALSYTFKDYREKVEITDRFVSDYTICRTSTLDDLVSENVDFIKMDIEGNEYAAMLGAAGLIRKARHIRLAVCAYHGDHDGLAIETLAESLGLKVSYTEGYMFFPYGGERIKQTYIMPTLRKGIIRCEK